jgi:hypothetical protein
MVPVWSALHLVICTGKNVSPTSNACHGPPVAPVLGWVIATPVSAAYGAAFVTNPLPPRNSHMCR